jgi:hypothetical protein
VDRGQRERERAEVLRALVERVTVAIAADQQATALLLRLSELEAKDRRQAEARRQAAAAAELGADLPPLPEPTPPPEH